jgi:hypothetical protein
MARCRIREGDCGLFHVLSGNSPCDQPEPSGISSWFRAVPAELLSLERNHRSLGIAYRLLSR